MEWFTAIVYGIVQGIAEFLPISSSGHLAILQSFFSLEGTDELFTFNVMLHLGTLAAVFAVYGKDIVSLVPAFFRILGKLFTGRLIAFSDKESDRKGRRATLNADSSERLIILVAFGTLPLVLAAFFNARIELLSAYPKIVGGILIFNGFVLFASDRIPHGDKRLGEAELLDAISVGLCQTAATLPGLSRSGTTITAGLLCGLDREDAVRYSFILSVPAILGASVLKLPDALNEGLSHGDAIPYALGTFTAAAVGFASIKLINYISKSSRLSFFAYYCWAVGLLAVIFA